MISNKLNYLIKITKLLTGIDVCDLGYISNKFNPGNTSLTAEYDLEWLIIYCFLFTHGEYTKASKDSDTVALKMADSLRNVFPVFYNTGPTEGKMRNMLCYTNTDLCLHLFSDRRMSFGNINNRSIITYNEGFTSADPFVLHAWNSFTNTRHNSVADVTWSDVDHDYFGISFDINEYTELKKYLYHHTSRVMSNKDIRNCDYPLLTYSEVTLGGISNYPIEYHDIDIALYGLFGS